MCCLCLRSCESKDPSLEGLQGLGHNYIFWQLVLHPDGRREERLFIDGGAA